jgi:hypothetical protein
MTTTALKDLIERTAAAWALAFVGLLLAAGFDYTDVSALKAAGLAAVPAALQVVYSFLASLVGDPKTAGLTDTRTR